MLSMIDILWDRYNTRLSIILDIYTELPTKDTTSETIVRNSVNPFNSVNGSYKAAVLKLWCFLYQIIQYTYKNQRLRITFRMSELKSRH